MRQSFGLALFFSLSLSAVAHAQSLPAPPTLEKQAAGVVKNAGTRNRFVTLNSENDLFGSGADRNYTNGLQLTYFDLGAEMPDFIHTIDDLVPTFSVNSTTSIAYTLGHNLYTPRSISRVTQDPNDRPWAAYLYGSATLTSITRNHVDSVEATIGVVGPLAMGKFIQTQWHEHISNSPRPRGWGNQLDNEPGVTLAWERHFPGRMQIDTLGWTATAVPYVGATVGNIYTYANTGFSLRLSPFAGRWQDIPVRVRPAMGGTGAFIVPEDTFGWYLFGGVDGRAVARNIFLDGNTFSDSHSVDKKNFVADINGGLAVTYGATRLSYTMVYRTKEFETQQQDGDLFGTISLAYRF